MLSLEVSLFRVRKGQRVVFQEAAPRAVPSKEKVPSGAVSLALGHRLVRAVQGGESRDFSDLARGMGLSQARVSQLVALTFLAPDIQEELLAGGPAIAHLNIHHLLLVARLPTWGDQRALWPGFRKTVESHRGAERAILNPKARFRAPESARPAENGGRGGHLGRSSATSSRG